MRSVRVEVLFIFVQAGVWRTVAGGFLQRGETVEDFKVPPRQAGQPQKPWLWSARPEIASIVVGQRSDDDAPREGGMRQYLVPAPDHRFRWLGVLPPNRTTEDAWIGLEVGWR